MVRSLPHRKQVALAALSFALAAAALLGPPPARAVGFLAPPAESGDPRAKSSLDLEERNLRLDVVLGATRATVSCSQIFYNPCRESIPVRFVLPLPRGATLTSSSLALEPVGREAGLAAALHYATARGYPWLLGVLDGELFWSAPTAVSPHRPLSVTVGYTLPALALGPERLWRVPGRRRGPPSLPLRSLAVVVRAEPGSTRRIESLSHGFEPPLSIDRAPRLETNLVDAVPEEDLLLAASPLAQPPPRALAYSDEDGTWLLARLDLPPVDRAKARAANPLAALFALDTSGTVRERPLEATRAGVRACLKDLKAGERFNLVSFALIPRQLHNEFLPIPLDREHDGQALRDAEAFLEGLDGYGGTNLGETIQQSAEMLATAPRGLCRRLFLTIDGKADAGAIDSKTLCSLFDELVPRDVRVEIAAMGVEVDGRLLASMVHHRGGRLRFVEPGQDVAAVLAGLLATTVPPWASIDVAVEAGGVPADCRTNVDRALYGDVPLYVGVLAPKGTAPSLKLSVVARDACGSTVSTGLTTFTRVVSVPFDEVGEAVRSLEVAANAVALVEAVVPPTCIPPLEGWRESRLRRILGVPTGLGERERLNEVAGDSGPEMRARLRMLERLTTFGTYLPRQVEREEFRRVGRRVLFRERDGRWVEQPDVAGEAQAVPFAGPTWRDLATRRADLRPVLALGTRLRFRDGERAVEVTAPPGAGGAVVPAAQAAAAAPPGAADDDEPEPLDGNVPGPDDQF